MLEIQKFLNDTNGDLEKLRKDYKVKHTINKDEDLISLCYRTVELWNDENYEQLKFHPIVKECRGIVLENKTWNLVANTFDRFYNLNECEEDLNKFNFNNFYAFDKEDGTLIIIYNYKGKWRANTKATFTDDGSKSSSNRYWKDMVLTCFNMHSLEYLDDMGFDKNCSYIFELCIPNLIDSIVKEYDKYQMFLLSIFEKEKEFNFKTVENFYNNIKNNLPQGNNIKLIGYKNIQSLLDAHNYVKELEEKKLDDEGLVLRDDKNIRIKMKNLHYLEKFKAKYQILSLRNVLEIIIENKHESFIQSLPNYKDYINEILGDIQSIARECVEEYKRLNYLCNDPKAFAEEVKKLNKSYMIPILFKINNLRLKGRLFVDGLPNDDELYNEVLNIVLHTNSKTDMCVNFLYKALKKNMDRYMSKIDFKDPKMDEL